MRRTLAALVLIGCAGPADLEPIADSERFRVSGDPGAVCPEITGWLERHAQVYEALFEVDPAIIDYEIHPDTNSLSAAGCETLGCAGGGRVRSVFPVHAHELVHAVGERRGAPPHLISEGLAQVFGCQPGSEPAVVADRALAASILSSTEFDAATARGAPTYGVAASLVRHLLDRFGDRAVIELYGRLDHEASAADVTAAVAASLGVDLEAELDRWVAGPPSRICRRDVECAMFALRPNVALDGELMCGRLGSPAELPLTIEVGAAGPIAIDVAGQSVRAVTLSACDGGPAIASGDLGAGAVVDVEPGRYELRIAGARAGDPIAVSWSPLAR